MAIGKFDKIASRLAVAFLIAASFAQSARAADAPAADDANVVQSDVQDVIVTGTRAQQRTVAKSAVPIDVISAVDLKKTGKQNIRDALQQLVPSYNNASGWTGGTGESIKSASLRGLNSDQTLVLVDGKRRHGHAVVFVTARGNLGASPVDLDLIPTSAVDHIEVLRDGAAAQYGSDAIAGVINIILKKNNSGGSASVTYGQFADGDEDGSGKGETVHAAGNQGVEFGKGGFLNLSADVDIHNFTNRLGSAWACNNATRAYTCLYPAGDPRENNDQGRNRGKQGLPRGQTYNIGYNAEAPINPDVTFYSFSTASHQYSQNFGIYRNPASLQNLPSVYPEGYTPQFTVITDDTQLVNGLKGTDLLGWNWDLSSSYSHVTGRLENNKDLNPSLGPVNPQTDFYLGSVLTTEWTNNFDISRPVKTGLFTAPLDVALGAEFRWNQFHQTPGDPGSYQIGSYTFPVACPAPCTDPNYNPANAGRAPSGGASGLGGFAPDALGNGHRSNTAGYVDFEQKITPDWEVGVAGRLEHYSDVGNNATGKVSTRYEFIKGFAFRGSVSNGFRAPSLQQQFYSSILPNYVNNTNFGRPGATSPATVLSQTNYIPASNPIAQALGARELKPEKSNDISVGFTAQPTRKTNLTVDAYQINITDRILATGSLACVDAGYAGCTAFRNAVSGAGGDPNGTYTYFTNAADTRTRGIDIVGDYKVDYGDWGAIKYSVTSAFNWQKVLSLAPTPAVLQSASLTVFDRSRIGDLTKAYPKNRTTLGADWQIGDWGINLRETRYSETWYIDPTTPNRDSKNSAAFITDLDIGYNVSEALKISVGANNLFNKYPDQLNTQAKQFYGWWAQTTVYNLTSPYGYNGGFYYARLDYTW